MSCFNFLVVLMRETALDGRRADETIDSVAIAAKLCKRAEKLVHDHMCSLGHGGWFLQNPVASIERRRPQRAKVRE